MVAAWHGVTPLETGKHPELGTSVNSVQGLCCARSAVFPATSWPSRRAGSVVSDHPLGNVNAQRRRETLQKRAMMGIRDFEADLPERGKYATDEGKPPRNARGSLGTGHVASNGGG